MKVASFNIQKFGKSKLSDPFVLKTLIKIVSRYDIIVILEVVDSSGDSVDNFLKELNKFNKTHRYTLEISTRLGRESYKEQFMFLYRDDLVDLVGSYQYKDNQPGDEDAFAREPYVLRFKCHTTVLADLVLMPVHTKPEDSVKELDELYDVFQDVKTKWKTDNIMILGDFNADGSYVSGREMKTIRIRSDKNFHWLITDDEDTTTSTKNDNTYDRIVVYGDDMLKAVVPNSAKPFNFQKAYKLTDEEALKVSDHYPVEVELKRKRIMKVASFNIQKLGEKKISDPSVMQTLIKIVSRYDIIVILKVVDLSGAAAKEFLKALNEEKVVDLVESYQYEDNQPGDEDAFDREPYAVRFRCRNTVLEDLVLIAVHIKPEDAEKELDELYDVFRSVTEKWKTENIMILGEFNTDGRYLSEAAKKRTKIWGNNFHWLIEDGVDTTASNNNEYTYDQIVVYGDVMLNAVVPNSAKSFNFQKAYELTDEEARRVSDHYPVQVKLK
ncbi:hypothetical protein cypCar_00033470 [Cyprinus carpio]|nr:hypothetical protein cypCar_00033470 [Cyprinus carpio]